MKRLTDLRLPIDQIDRLEAEVAQQLKLPLEAIGTIQVIKRSLDARKKPRLSYVFTVDVYLKGEPGPEAARHLPRLDPVGHPPVIVGAGPGGLFAALRLIDQGLPCVVFDRGAEIHPRTVSINMFWKKGELNHESNVCFGEGGAGLFSDGKLITRIKSPHIRYVLERLVDFGAPPEIVFVNNPHVGSDKLRKVIRRMVAWMREQGCTFHYNTRVEKLLLDEARQVRGVQLHDGREVACDRVLLATGHSARDTYRMLEAQGVALEAKSFAMGLRIEHPQALINQVQLGSAAVADELGAAQYRLTWNEEGASVYSFCMCPGGYVLSAGTEPDGVVSNGMSNYHRGSKWANAALVVPVAAEDLPGDNPFRILDLQRRVEHAAWTAVQAAGGTHQLPGQRVTDYLRNRLSSDLPKVSSPSGATSVELNAVLPDAVNAALHKALQVFQRRMPGFISDEVVLLGVESRTSAPLRVPRHPETLQSLNTPGLYPVGEGAGYAGGITSAAVDGIRAVTAMLTPLPSTQSTR